MDVKFKSVAECDASAKDQPGIHVIKFGAAWCGPCKFLDKSLENMVNTGVIGSFNKVDVDISPEVMIELSLTSVPYGRVYTDGVFAGSFNGILSNDILNEILTPKPESTDEV